jgi:hypothetical protein
MYALFFEDSGELIATLDRAPHAIGLGRLVSREKGRVVIGVLNHLNGTTEISWRFVSGRQVSPQATDDELASVLDAEPPVDADKPPSAS